MTTAISLYSGAGGLDYGFEAADFETRVCLDFDADSCATIRRSRPEWPVIEGDALKIPPERILETARLSPGQADVLIGGPPCQPFSKSGFWHSGESRRLNDPRSDTIGQYLDTVRLVQPRALLFENVEGLGFSGKDEGLEFVREGLREINSSQGTNYQPVSTVLNASSYGVPQHRNRLFIVAARDGTRFRFPDQTHGDPAASSDLKPWSTTWDALGDLDCESTDEALAPTGKWAELLPTIPEGQNYLFHTARGGGEPLFGWRTRFWCFLLKLAKNQPSWTIQAQPGPATGPFHWRSRHLSMRELCRLQTFPDDVSIVGDRRSAQRQLGNAVPSLLAEVIAREIRTQLLRLPPVEGAPKLLPHILARPIPSPERPTQLPAKYRSLIGLHGEHPGTGLGPGARARKAASSS